MTKANPFSLAVTPDGSMLLSGHADGRIGLWRLPSGEPAGVLGDHRVDNPVRGLAVTPDGSTLVSAASLADTRLWRLPGGPEVGRLENSRYLASVVVSPDGGVVVGGGLFGGWDVPVKLRRLPSGREAGTLGPGTWGSAMAMTADGALLVTVEGRLWYSALVALCRKPVEEVDPAGIQRLRVADPEAPAGERAWLALVEALAGWRRRYDIAVDVDDTTASGPGAADVELEDG